ncbi:Hypothetical_protein [Hexamita inflata]|uniref:Hypothetical_protein n=1 Tax=Hexamita inflata TaxID=28002 RepID=A0AA86NMB4_9EUKA|nr:Hypothetical protein HINF_LOCUS9667 [Hexamita inflata]
MMFLNIVQLNNCAMNNVNVSGTCRQLYKDASGVYYNISTVKKYIMCSAGYTLQQSACLRLNSLPNIQRDVSRYSAISNPLLQCQACISKYVIDYASQQCVLQKVIDFTQITCFGYVTVASDLAGTLLDQISLCSLSSDPSFASNSIISFETTVQVSASTAIGLFSQITTFSNVVVNGILTVKQSKSQSQVFIGSLVGLMNTNLNVQNCTVNIRFKLEGQQSVFKSGGIVGMIQGQYLLLVQNCTISVTVDILNQADNTGKSWYSVSGGIVGHLHLVPTLQIDNTNTTLNIQTTRAAGGFLGILQGGVVIITHSISKGTAKAYSCGGMLGEAGAPGLTPTQTQQVTLDSVRSEMQMSGTLNGVIIGQGCKKTVIQFVGTNTYATNGVCITGNANGLTFSGTTGC